MVSAMGTDVNPMTDSDPMANRRTCTATAKQTGKRCTQIPPPGMTVCRFHGGAAPQVVAAAQRRLMEASLPAASVLIREAATADKSSDRIRASSEILDRAGIGRQPSGAGGLAPTLDQVQTAQRSLDQERQAVAEMSREELEQRHLRVMEAVIRQAVTRSTPPTGA